MQTLKLIVGLGGLSLQAAQNLQVTDSQVVSSDVHACQAIFMTDEPTYSPPMVGQLSSMKTVVIPKMAPAAADLAVPEKIQEASRRLLRQHFWQHQALFWQAFDRAVAQAEDPSAVHLVLLVDCANALASSVCWDVLCQIRLNYADIRCYVVFLVPSKPQNINPIQQLNVAALLSEYNAMAQKDWLPTRLDTQVAYPIEDIHLWEASFLYERPEKSDVDFDYAQLVDQVVSLPQQKLGVETFENVLREDFPKFADKGKKVILPRLVSLVKASLQMDMAAAQKLLTQTVQIQLLNLLLQPPRIKKTDLKDPESLLQAGWILAEERLLLNQALDLPIKTPHESIEKEWQVRGDFFVQQVQDLKKLSWKEKADELQNMFQKAYDKYFRGVGVEQYYSLSQSRLERLSETQGNVIEANIWGKCFQGDYDLYQLLTQIPEILAHYILLQEKFELQQRRMRAEYLVQQATWTDTMDGWSNSARRERARIEQTTLVELGNILKSQYILQCHYKAFSFAIKAIDVLMPRYQSILNSVDGVKKLWQHKEQEQSVALQQLEESYQNIWVSKNHKNGVHQYLLQPTANTAQYLLKEFVDDLGEWVPEMLSTWTKRLGEQSDFTQFLAWMKQGQWFALLERISGQISYRVSTQTPNSGANPLSLIFEQRLTELTQLQVQQLSKHISDSMNSTYQQQWERLGKILSEQHKPYASAAILCSLDLQNPEAQTVVLWMKEIAKRVNPNVAVIPTNTEHQIQMVRMSTAYLQEWLPLQHYQSVYQRYAHQDRVLEMIHIDGTAAQLRHVSVQLGQRNFDLVRQHLLLAKISGHLVYTSKGFELTVHVNGQKTHVFDTRDLAELTDTIPLSVVRDLVEHNRQLRERSPQAEAKIWNRQLDDILTEMRALYVPEGMDLADMDWKDAGKYVVWTRTVQNLRKYWVQQPEANALGTIAVLNQ